MNESEIFGQRLGAAGSEIGGNDFRLSDVGGIGGPIISTFDGHRLNLAANPTEDEYLVAWHADEDVDDLTDGELEIFGQRLGEALIFADGFESGGTAAWSSTTP